MTLAEAIRKSRETGCEFWRPECCSFRWNVERRVWQKQCGGWYFADKFTPYWTIDDLLADDWQVEQTAPHGEGM